MGDTVTVAGAVAAFGFGFRYVFRWNSSSMLLKKINQMELEGSKHEFRYFF